MLGIQAYGEAVTFAKMPWEQLVGTFILMTASQMCRPFRYSLQSHTPHQPLTLAVHTSDPPVRAERSSCTDQRARCRAAAAAPRARGGAGTAAGGGGHTEQGERDWGSSNHNHAYP